MRSSVPSIDGLLPHGPPMRLLEQTEQWDEASVRCTATVREDNPFVRDGVAPTAVLLEYVAQAVAVHLALRELRGSTSPRPGLVASVRSVTFSVDELRVGDRLEITASVESDAGDLARYASHAALVEDDGRRRSAADASLTVLRSASLGDFHGN